VTAIDGPAWAVARRLLAAVWVGPADVGRVSVDLAEQVIGSARWCEQVVEVESQVAVAPVRGPGLVRGRVGKRAIGKLVAGAPLRRAGVDAAHALQSGQEASVVDPPRARPAGRTRRYRPAPPGHAGLPGSAMSVGKLLIRKYAAGPARPPGEVNLGGGFATGWYAYSPLSAGSTRRPGCTGGCG